METVNRVRQYMLHSDLVKFGALLKERADKYAQGYSFQRMRQELETEIGAAISEKQMALAWYVLEGAGVVKRMTAKQGTLLPQGGHDERLKRIEEQVASLMAELGIGRSSRDAHQA